MVVLKYSLLFSALFSVHVFALGEENISFDNKLSACAQIKNWKVIPDSDIPLLSFEVELNKSIGECGCKSALSSFTVSADKGDYSSFLMAGKINFLKSGKSICHCQQIQY